MARIFLAIENSNNEVIAKYDVSTEEQIPDPLTDLPRSEVDTFRDLSDMKIDQYDPDALDPEVRAVVGDPPELEPDPDEALDLILQQVAEWVGGLRQAYVELEKRAGFTISVLAGRFEDTKVAIDDMENDGTLTAERAQNLRDILDGTQTDVDTTT